MSSNDQQPTGGIESQVYEALNGVNDPEIHRPITELGMVPDVRLEGERLVVSLALPYAKVPVKDELVNLIHELHLGEQVSFAYHLFHNRGLSNTNGEFRFSLSDACSRSLTVSLYI